MFYTCLSVILSTGGVSQYTHGQMGYERGMWTGVYTPPLEMATAAVGTHPTGMHTCNNIRSLVRKMLLYKTKYLLL